MTRFLTILPGIGLICGAIYAAVNERHMDVAYNRLMLGVAAIGGGLGLHRTHQEVTADRAATQRVTAKVDDLHGKLASMSGDNIPAARPPTP